jgi:hypothetical protein
MSSRAAAATSSIRPLSNNETLTLEPGRDAEMVQHCAPQGDLPLRRDRQFERH